MAIIQATVILPNDNGVAEDEVMNNFTFSTADASAGILDKLHEALRSFYNDINSPSVKSVGNYLSAFVDGANARLKFINLSDPKPRVPIRTDTFPVTPDINAGLPCEVAAVCSFQTQRVSGTDMARGRGRIYLGPLSSQALSPGTGDMRISLALRDISNLAAYSLFQDSSLALDWTWVVYSTGARDNSDTTIPYKERPLLPPAFYPVTNGWTDDAPDTQRRRGHRTTVRFPWGTAATVLPADTFTQGPLPPR